MKQRDLALLRLTLSAVDPAAPRPLRSRIASGDERLVEAYIARALAVENPEANRSRTLSLELPLAG